MKTFLFVACVLATIDVAAQGRVEALDSVLTVLHDRELFSGVLLVAEKNQVVYSGARGNSPDGNPVTLSTPLGLASVTKPFTAAAVMLLANEGRIDYDVPITSYIPELPYDDVTVRHLLNHTGGVHFLTLINAVWDTTGVLDNEKLIALASEHRPALLFDPGEKYAYSNDGYTVLASLIERVSGQSYESFLRERIFDPLDMESVYVDHIPEGRASGWLRCVGAAGVVASAEDLFALDQAMQPGRLFSEEELEEAYRPPVFADGSRGNVGFGWQIADGPERRVFTVATVRR